MEWTISCWMVIGSSKPTCNSSCAPVSRRNPCSLLMLSCLQRILCSLHRLQVPLREQALWLYWRIHCHTSWGFHNFVLMSQKVKLKCVKLTTEGKFRLTITFFKFNAIKSLHMYSMCHEGNIYAILESWKKKWSYLLQSDCALQFLKHGPALLRPDGIQFTHRLKFSLYG